MVCNKVGLYTLVLLAVTLCRTVRGDVAQDWKCPEDYTTNGPNILQNPGFEDASLINSGGAAHWLNINYVNNFGHYDTNNVGPAYEGSANEKWGSDSANNPNLIEYQDVDGVSGGPSLALSSQPYLFSFFVAGEGITDIDRSGLIVTWNGATISDDAPSVEEHKDYAQYCLPVALIGSHSKNTLTFGGYIEPGDFLIDNVAMIPYGTISYASTAIVTIANPTIVPGTTTTSTSTEYTSTSTTAMSTSTYTPTITITPAPTTSSVVATSTATTTGSASTVTLSTLQCTQAHLTFSSACCPRSLCKTISQPSATPRAAPHRRLLEEAAFAKRDTITAGQQTIPLSGSAPTVFVTDTTTATVSTITTPVTVTLTISTDSTTTIPSTIVTAISTSTVNLTPTTVTTTYSTYTSTSTILPPARTVGACKKVYNVPQFPCPKGVKQQAALSAFELGLLKEYKVLAPKAFPTVLVSCQGDSKTYIY